MLESDTRLGICYDRFMLVCIVASIVPLCFKENFTVFLWLDRITVTVFIVDYLFRWITADMKCGDIYPTSDTGRVFSMLSSFMGIAIVALPTGIITAGYMNELDKNK
jgi:hypothetical protein